MPINSLNLGKGPTFVKINGRSHIRQHKCDCGYVFGYVVVMFLGYVMISDDYHAPFWLKRNGKLYSLPWPPCIPEAIDDGNFFNQRGHWIGGIREQRVVKATHFWQATSETKTQYQYRDQIFGGTFHMDYPSKDDDFFLFPRKTESPLGFLEYPCLWFHCDLEAQPHGFCPRSLGGNLEKAV